MTKKGRRKSTRNVNNLKVKSLSADKAKHVKGGPIVWPGGPLQEGMTGLRQQAPQKVQE